VNSSDKKLIPYSKLLDDFKLLLRRNGLKFTVQREMILDVLYNSSEHLTPEELYELVKEQNPNLKTGIATVYRTLSLLEGERIVSSLSFGAQGKKYELGAKEHHDHMICTSCASIIEFVDEIIERRQQEIAKQFGFDMRDHSMQIYGICKNCKEKEK